MILVTGGTGFIGSHTVVELLEADHEVLVVDNLSNSKASVLDRIQKITGRRPGFVEGDVRDRRALQALFAAHKIHAVIHFAGLKTVEESVTQPLRYYDNNCFGSLMLLECMAEAGVKQMVFSSSAAVYGEPASVPVREDAPLSPAHPYGKSKLFIEDMLRDLQRADSSWHIALLRYVNPVGAHPSGLIGEDPNGIPNNLMPCIAQVAAGKLKELSIFGSDYATPDGTGVRDYIHVHDLARGHLAALAKISAAPGLLTVNLGTGQGYSVLEMVSAFESACGRTLPRKAVARRAGDIAAYYADTRNAWETLAWRAEFGINEMCRDTWRWQQWWAENQGN